MIESRVHTELTCARASRIAWTRRGDANKYVKEETMTGPRGGSWWAEIKL